MYIKDFEIRWSDIDANRHLANSAYVNFMAHTRMSFLLEMGFSPNFMKEHAIGPVVFYEHIYYFKEVFLGQPIKVSLELVGMSEDGKFFEFLHLLYDTKGRNFARGEMMGAWIDMETRKLKPLPEAFLQKMETIEKGENFKILTKEDTRKYARAPKDLV